MAFVWLRSNFPEAVDGRKKYVTAEGGGGTWLYANRDVILGWESFVLQDDTPSTQWLCNKDVIGLRAPSGQWVCADTNRGPDAPLVADRADFNGWERFTVQCINSDGSEVNNTAVIGNADEDLGTLVILKAHNGRLVQADHGSGRDRRLYARGTYVGDWERFLLGYGGGGVERLSNAVWRNMNPVQ
jgi:hypothetical protein